MKYKIEKNTVQETLIIPLYARKVCSELYPSRYRDETAVRLFNEIDYDFSTAEKNARTNRLDPEGFYNLLAEMTAKYPKEWKEVRDKYEADGITKHSPRFNAMLDRYEELLTILKTMVDEAKE